MLKGKSHYLKCLVMLALMLGIGMLPPLGGDITPLGMQVLGIFVGLLFGWTCLDFFGVSVVALLALGLTDYTTVMQSFGAGFGSSLTLQIMFLLIIVGYLEESGLPNLITGWFLTRKILRGRPYLLFAAIFTCSAILMALGLSLGAVFLLWVIMYGIFELLGYQKGDRLVSYLLFGVVVLGVIGNSIPSFQIFPVLVINILEQTLAITVSPGKWMAWNTLFFLVYLFLYLFFGKYILKLDVSKFVDQDDLFNQFKDKKATAKQKTAAIFIGIFIVILLLPTLLPKTWFLTGFLSKFGLVGAAVVLIAGTACLRIAGEPVTNWDDNARRGIQWGLIAMFAATTPISSALESDATGIISTLVSVLTPLVSGLSPYVFYLFVFLIFFVLTQFAHNLVLAAVLTPSLLQFSVLLGANPVFLIAGICATAQMAYLTPGASSPAAVFHGNTQWISVKHAYLFGAFGALLGLVAILICTPIGHLLF